MTGFRTSSLPLLGRCATADGGPAVVCGTSINLTGLALGEHILVITATDGAGNVGTLIRRFVDQMFRKYNIEPRIVMELSSSEEVKRMAEISMGAAIVSKLSVTEELKRGSLRLIKVSELETTHPVGVVYKAGRYLRSAMKQFLSDLKGMPEDQFISSE